MEGSKGPMLGFPYLPNSVVDEHYEKMRNKTVPAVISEDPRIERVKLMFATVQNGTWRDFFPPNKRHLIPFDKLDDGARFPRGGVFIWHGNEDSVVPVRGSVKLKEKVAQLDPELDFHLVVRPGDHGFDFDASIDDGWMADGLKNLVPAWLG
jgi:hypothetical protein